jgi:hypothetical protein
MLNLFKSTGFRLDPTKPFLINSLIENNNIFKSKKPSKNGKLFIGLTTKPFPVNGINNTTELILKPQDIWAKKHLIAEVLPKCCGLDGTRTRDPLRDRQVF